MMHSYEFACGDFNYAALFYHRQCILHFNWERRLWYFTLCVKGSSTLVNLVVSSKLVCCDKGLHSVHSSCRLADWHTLFCVVFFFCNTARCGNRPLGHPPSEGDRRGVNNFAVFGGEIINKQKGLSKNIKILSTVVFIPLSCVKRIFLRLSGTRNTVRYYVQPIIRRSANFSEHVLNI